MARDEEEDEITIDFSKIKNIFGKKTSDKVKDTKEEVKEVEEKVDEKIKEDPSNKELQEDKKEIQEIKEDLKKEEDEATIIEAEKKLVEKNLQEDQKKIDDIQDKVEDDDEEISIDFSKIKKAITKTEKSEEKEEAKESDDEISIDFSKIKGVFKGLKETKSEPSDDDVNVDIRGTIDFFKTHSKYILPVILIVVAMSFSIYLRAIPADLPITDEWATNSVENQIRQSIRQQIDQQYPNLPDANKASLVEAEFLRVRQEQKSQIDAQIQGTSNFFKTRLQDDSGQTYLLAIDPYFWLRHAQNVLDNGHPGDEIRNGRIYDNKMLAPKGRNAPPDMFHAYFIAYTYKFVNTFNKNINLMGVAFYIPILLSALCIIPAFFIGRRLNGNFAGFVAAMVVAIHPAFLTRTAGGFSDTDAYNVLFPLLVTWFFLEAFESKSLKWRVINASIAGLFVGLFSFAWGGWYYIFDFALVVGILYLVYLMIMHFKELVKTPKTFFARPSFYNTLTLLGVFILSSAIFTTIFTDFAKFTVAFFLGPWTFATLKQVGITTIWPNVYTTVAEQNPASLNSAISQIGVGSSLLFLIGISGVALTTIKKDSKKLSDLWFVIGTILWFIIILGIKPQNLVVFLALISVPIIIKGIMILKNKDEEVDIKAAILLILWFIATIYASVKGVRFTLLAVPAFAIAFGVALGLGYRYFSALITKSLKVTPWLSKSVVIILFLFLLLGPYRSAETVARSEIPSMNDDWYNSLNKIDLEAQPNAIINSWWDFGHWFKAIGNRPVTFDGTSQNSPNAHWVGSVLSANDEQYAIGTLRMIDCYQNEAYNELLKVTIDGAEAIDVINEIVVLDRVGAKEVLEGRGYSGEVVELVLERTHCEPPENYFITSYDMVGKSGVWSHFGAWDYDRSLIFNTLKKREYSTDPEKSIEFMMERFNYTYDLAESLYYEVQAIGSDSDANSWIAPWPSYAGVYGCSRAENQVIRCDIGNGASVEINIDSLQADIQTPQGVRHPNSVVMPIEGGDYKVREFNETIGASLVLIPAGPDVFSALMLSPELDEAMFTKLFYLNGHGLDHFEKFSDVRDITGGRIIVWKVNWDGEAQNLYEYFEALEAQRIAAENANNSDVDPSAVPVQEPAQHQGGLM